MDKYWISGSILTSIADAIRLQADFESTYKMTPRDMPGLIQNGTIPVDLVTRTITSITNTTIDTVGDYAFANCLDLHTINLPNANNIGVSAFYNCKPSNVTLGVTIINPDEKIDVVSSMLNGNTNLQYLNLPECTNLMSSAVSGATNLISVSLPKCTQITQSAFYHCTSLKSAILPKVVSTLGKCSFDGCTSLSIFSAPLVSSANGYALRNCPLKTLYMPALTGWSTSNPLTSVTTLESVTTGHEAIPAWSAHWPNLKYYSNSNATTITAAAFSGCTNLKAANFHAPNLTAIAQSAFRNGGFDYANSAIFPNVTGTIGAYAFYQCASLSSVNLPGVTSLAAGVFKGCTTLKYVKLAALTSLAVNSNHSTFADCPALQSIYLTNYTAPIVRYTFYSNTALTTVSIPKATQINSYAFHHCTALRTISLPAVTTIQANAFSGATALSSVDIGTTAATKVTIAAQAFINLASLSTLKIRYTSLASLANVNAFTGTGITSTTGSIYVPNAWLASYKAATNWKTFSARMIGF